MIVLAISDIQAPFFHPDMYEFLKMVTDSYKPDQVIQMGDLVDKHALSRYPRDPDGLSAGQELDKAVESLQPLMRMYPNMKVVIGNHDRRGFDRAFEAGIPKRLLVKGYKEMLDAPVGWDFREHFIIEGVRYEHGDRLNGGAKSVTQRAPIDRGRSTVFGHFHSSAGVHYTSNPDKLLFGLNTGCLIDPHAYVFNYARFRPILGCGIILDGVTADFVPMLLNKKGRWVGRI